MKYSLITASILLYLTLTCCAKQESSNLQSSHVYLKDSERQQNIEDIYKDNFNFDQFEGIDWSEPSTFGPLSPGLIAQKIEFIQAQDYYVEHLDYSNFVRVDVRGDGSCWIRSAFHAVIFDAFQDENSFDELIKNIRKAKVNFGNIPGFNTRFQDENLIRLLLCLKDMSFVERLENYNKPKVDDFLEFNFRALIHAYWLKKWSNTKDPQQCSSPDILKKEYLVHRSWGNPYNALMILKNILMPESKKRQQTFSESPALAYSISNNHSAIALRKDIAKNYFGN